DVVRAPEANNAEPPVNDGPAKSSMSDAGSSPPGPVARGVGRRPDSLRRPLPTRPSAPTSRPASKSAAKVRGNVSDSHSPARYDSPKPTQSASAMRRNMASESRMPIVAEPGPSISTPYRLQARTNAFRARSARLPSNGPSGTRATPGQRSASMEK